jgi:hypothetical protein
LHTPTSVHSAAGLSFSISFCTRSGPYALPHTHCQHTRTHTHTERERDKVPDEGVALGLERRRQEAAHLLDKGEDLGLGVVLLRKALGLRHHPLARRALPTPRPDIRSTPVLQHAQTGIPVVGREGLHDLKVDVVAAAAAQADLGADRVGVLLLQQQLDNLPCQTPSDPKSSANVRQSERQRRTVGAYCWMMLWHWGRMNAGTMLHTFCRNCAISASVVLEFT